MASKKLSLFPLILLIIAAIDNIRNLPSSALFGSALIFFFILSAIVFLIPRPRYCVTPPVPMEGSKKGLTLTD